MDRKKVVTVFIRANGKILILKRSSAVRRMSGRWAGVSGYLEGDEPLLRRAFNEADEEVGLDRRLVKIVRMGFPLSAPDIVDENLTWVVYPFLFDAGRFEIKLNWESEDFAWIRPREIAHYETVPMLQETLRRVL